MALLCLLCADFGLNIKTAHALIQSATIAPGAAHNNSFTGQIQDPSRAIVSGARVQLRRLDGSILSTALTDGAGQFRLQQPGSGAYVLAVDLAGFQPLTLNINFPSARSTPLIVTLNLAVVSTSVVVKADDDIMPAAPDQNQDSAAISADDMKSLPIFDDDVVATLSGLMDTGAAGEAGTTLVVDGVETKSVGVAPSAIQQVSINQDPYSARYTTPGRGQIEITTKSTADHFHGAFNFTFRDAALNASNYFAASKPPEQRRIYEGYLTGPVMGVDRTAFLLSINHQEDNLFAQVDASTAAGLKLQENAAAPTRSTAITMKVNHQFSDRNFAYILYQYFGAAKADQNVGGVVLPSAGYQVNNFDQNIVFHDDFAISPNKINQFSILVEKNLDTTISDQQVTKVVVAGAFTSGGAQNDAVNSEYNPNVSDIVSWTHTKQQFKFGIQIPNMGRRILEDRTNRLGTYSFSSLAAYQSNAPSTFSIQQGQVRFLTHFLQPGAFFQDQIQLTKRTTVTPGLRYDWQGTIPNTRDAFEPRLSIAYLLDKQHAMVLRMGGGIYVRRVGVNIGQQLARYQFAAERNLLLTSNLCYPDITACYDLSAQSPSLFSFEPNLKSPVQSYYSLGLERQLTKSATLTIGYSGYRGWHVLRSVDVNAPLPPFTSPIRPNTNYSQILQLQSRGYQTSDSLNASFRGRIGTEFTGLVQYTLQHADSNTSFSTFNPANQYDPNAEWSRSDWDQRHRLYFLGTFYPARLYNLGIGFYADSPEPYSETTGTDSYLTGILNARPPGVPRNSLNAGGYQDVDVRWGYNFKLQPRKKDASPAVGFSLAAFNVLNRVNYASYIGVITSPLFREPTQAYNARRLQVGGSYNF